jgi:hypothetical protein
MQPRRAAQCCCQTLHVYCQGAGVWLVRWQKLKLFVCHCEQCMMQICGAMHATCAKGLGRGPVSQQCHASVRSSSRSWCTVHYSRHWTLMSHKMHHLGAVQDLVVTQPPPVAAPWLTGRLVVFVRPNGMLAAEQAGPVDSVRK